MSSTLRPNTGAAAATSSYAGYDQRAPVIHETLGEMAVRLASAYAHARAIKRQRRALAELDERLLIDIGFALDEIPRVRAGDKFTPRALEPGAGWRTRRGG